MNQTYIKSIDIKKVRHLENIIIPISYTERKHLIITGKNGCGKTSLLDAVKSYLEFIVANDYEDVDKTKNNIEFWKNNIKTLGESESDRKTKSEYKHQLDIWNIKLLHYTHGAVADIGSNMDLREKYANGKFILAYYKAYRILNTESYKNIEKVELKKYYAIDEKPGTKLTKYMVDLKARQAFSEEGSEDRENINNWFTNFENMLRQIFNDDSIKLVFDKNSFQFTLFQNNKDKFDFNTLSSGYAAIFEIISDLIMRMEAETQVRNTFEMEGIVLIDEIETHLHIELQKNILSILTTVFPNIQFIVTTHSPYILNSIENAKVFDLEKKIEMENLTGYSAGTLGEGYFGVDDYSEILKNELNQYEKLCSKKEISDYERALRAEIRNKWKNRKYPISAELYEMFMEIEDKRKIND